MVAQLKNINFYLVFFIDLILFTLSLWLAYQVRFDFNMAHSQLDQFFYLLPLFLLYKSLSFFLMDLYRGMYRYAGVTDLMSLTKAVTLSTLLLLTTMLLTHRFQGFSRGIFLIDGGLTLLLTGGFRLLIRTLFRRYQQQENGNGWLPMVRPKKRMPILIYGAGNAGEKLYQEILDTPRMAYEVKGFADDNPHKKGRSIHGISVLGHLEDLPFIQEKQGIEMVIIAMPSATGRRMRAVVEACKAHHLAVKTLPSMGELMDGEVNMAKLREVNYRDLLRRKPVELDREGISAYLTEKIVLVTGAGGEHRQ